jgi:phage-related protein
MAGKFVLIDRRAELELVKFPEVVESDFRALFMILRDQGELDFPEARKVTKDLFELRVRIEGAYRGFYAYVGADAIVILHCYQKKSQKAPTRNLQTAKQRLRQYI